MFENLKSVLVSWNGRTSERQKLQHAYLFIAVATVFIAGIISLLNADLGHQAVQIAVFAVVAFVANGIVWNLLQSAVVSKLSSRGRRR